MTERQTGDNEKGCRGGTGRSTEKGDKERIYRRENKRTHQETRTKETQQHEEGSEKVRRQKREAGGDKDSSVEETEETLLLTSTEKRQTGRKGVEEANTGRQKKKDREVRTKETASNKKETL